MAGATKHYALVTGANRGLGLEVAKQLAALGKPLLITGRDSAKAAAAIKEIAAAAAANGGGGGAAVKALAAPLDAAKPADVAAVAEEVGRDYGQQIDLLINNAGMLVREAWTRDAYEPTLATNVSGPVRLTEALLPHLAPNAKIIMVSSGLGQLANLTPDYAAAVAAVSSLDQLRDATATVPFDAASPMATDAPGMGGSAPTYSVSKALLNRAVQLMAAASSSRGVSVYSVCPGWCRTDMGSAAAPRSAEQGAESILQPFTQAAGAVAAGSFTRDGEVVPW